MRLTTCSVKLVKIICHCFLDTVLTVCLYCKPDHSVCNTISIVALTATCLQLGMQCAHL